MDAQFIEKLDRRRYKYLLWQTVGFGLFLPGIIVNNWVTAGNGMTVGYAIFLPFMIIGTVLFVVGTLLVSREARRIRQNPELGKILNNELVVHYDNKSIRNAFMISLVVTIIFSYLSWNLLSEIPASTICLIIIYVAVLSLKISRLVYLRK